MVDGRPERIYRHTKRRDENLSELVWEIEGSEFNAV